jgi:flavin reductase (DIM6/NTAB) family NADH-FMN oxidoreductase RutF
VSASHSTAIELEAEFGVGVHALSPAAVNSHAVRTVFSRYPASVGALCAVVDGRPVGLIATSLAVGISYEPPMVAFSVRKKSTTWPKLKSSARIGVSVLSDSQGRLCRQIAGPAAERFVDCQTHETSHGSLFLHEAMTWLDCKIAGEVEVGDHVIILLELLEVGHDHQTAPLVFHGGRFHSLREQPSL